VVLPTSKMTYRLRRLIKSVCVHSLALGALIAVGAASALAMAGVVASSGVGAGSATGVPRPVAPASCLASSFGKT
jgi:hypothetical protein